MMFVAMVLGFFILLAFVIYLNRKYSYFSDRKIPYLRPLPFVGNLGKVSLMQQAFIYLMDDIYARFKRHKVAGLYSYFTPSLILMDPDLIKDVTVKDFHHFTDHQDMFSADPDSLFAQSLFALKGQRWKEMRAKLSPAFTSSKMRGMFVLISQIGEQLADYLDSEIDKQGGGVLTIDTKDMFTRYTNDVIATTAFGIQCDSLKDRSNEFYEMGKRASDFGGIRMIIMLLYFICPRLMRHLGLSFVDPVSGRFFRALVKETVATREREGIVRPDMIHLMMQVKKGELNEVEDEALESASRLVVTDDDIAAQAFVFFMAGFESSAVLLSFAAHELAMNLEIQQRLHEEIDATLQEHGGKLPYEAIHNMKYLDMVIQETLRLYPPASSMDRECVKPYTIPATKDSPEVHVRVGDILLIPVYSIQRDPEYYPDPDHFDPERFSENNRISIHPCTFIPFGFGPRSCIGNRFALMEAKMALTHLLTRFNLQPVSKTPNPIRLSAKTFNVMVDGGLWLGISRREKP